MSPASMAGLIRGISATGVLALFGAFHPHDPCGEKDAGDCEREDCMRLVAVMDSYCGINPPNDSSDEPNKGKIPHSHRGYLNDSSSQCDNSFIFRYFGNRTGHLSFKLDASQTSRRSIFILRRI
jgi:hypothetical protein